MQVTSQVMKQIQADLQKAYAEIATKYGLVAPAADVRRERNGSFARAMKVDFRNAADAVPVMKMPQGFIPEGVKDPLLARAMAKHGITTTKNSKGDTLTAFYPNSPKFCFGYTSGRGTNWKCSADQARKRFA